MTDEVWQSFTAATWTDLAANLPGDSVRRRADDLSAQWRSKPWLSRLVSPRAAERRSRRGAESEAVVGQLLMTLDTDWYVLNDVPLGESGEQISHLVIGPGGVFAIAAELHRGKRIWVSGDTIMVNGLRAYHTPGCRARAQEAAQRLSACVGFEVAVQGVVAMVGVTQFTDREQPRDGQVYVTTPRGARRWLRQQPARLTPDAVDRIYAMARRSTTWQRTADLDAAWAEQSG